MQTLSVEGNDGRKFEFRGDLTGMARLIGPQGGRYEFSAALLRAFLREWAAGINSTAATVSASDNRSFQFSGNLIGTARLVGPDGGTYEFDASLFREFLKRWARDSVYESALGK